jgi:DNA-binding transcriptional LysR family regulator
MDRLTSMTAFTKVVENEGFSAAGRHLNMSPAMVSNHIQALEEHLGARLLNRTTRKVSLTEVGKAYYDRCTQILHDVVEADETASALQSTPRGALRLNISPALAPAMVRPITEFVGRYRDASVDMQMTDRMVDLVEEGFDLSIRVTPVPDSTYIVRRLGSYRHILCGTPDYFAEHGTPKVPADLTKHNCLNYSYHPFGQGWRFATKKGEQTVRVTGNLHCNSSVTLSAMALQGQGLILVPKFLVAEDLEAGRLVSVMNDTRPIAFSIDAYYPHRRHLPAKVRVFIDLLVEHFSPYLEAG